LPTASAGRRGRLERLEERLGAHDREMQRLTTEVQEGERQIRTWREEAEKLSGRRAEQEAAIARSEAELQQALEQRAAAEDEVLAAQERLDQHRGDLRGLEERLAGHRTERDRVRGEVEELRIQQARLKQDAEHLALQFQEQFGRPFPGTEAEPTPGSTDAAIGLLPAAPRAEGEAVETAANDSEAPPAAVPAALPTRTLSAADLIERETELARCKDALDRLGPVNLLAVQEHDEQEERHTFLTAQRADVATSVDSLRQTIKEINEASAERFAATFAEVNKAFGEVFTRLFRGGEAEMRLLDEQDVLESGIEIVARPPGKRLQNLMLMSGGEKALTAIALLFALFRSKPSPFCILDEVDAPLDDVNTVRFVDLIQELAGNTQFIVITHNKLTMEAAATLYGVTMEERGVSKLVSVALEDVQPEQRRAMA
jgi:chromosome segregation protein